MGSEPGEDSDSVEPPEDKSNGIMAWNLNQKRRGMGSEPGEDSDSVEPLEPGEESELPQEADTDVAIRGTLSHNEVS